MFSKSLAAKGHFSKIIAAAFLAVLLGREVPGKQLPGQANSQINQQAAILATRPSKVRVTMASQDISVGAKSPIQITLLNTDDQPVLAREDWPCEVSLSLPSGKSSSQTVWIKKGESTAQFEFSAEQAGLTSISVRAPVNGVRPEKITLIVRTAKKSRKNARPRVSLQSPLLGCVEIACGEFEPFRAQLRTTRFELPPILSDSAQGPETHAASANDSPVLHVSVSNVGDNYVADGKDAVVISVFFESPDLSPAPTDIHIWFSWTNGLLDPPQPIEIKKGSFSTKTSLTSTAPADVAFKFVSSTPPYQAQGDTSFTVQFVPAGVALVGPDVLSVVDSAQVMIVFFDAQKKPISPGKNWPVTLRCKQSKLRFTPQSFEVQPASPTGSAVLFPVWFGSDTVEAVVANYSPEPLTIVITGWLVLGLCLGGGAAGGLAAYDKFKGSWIWRIFIGILGGAVLCWLYVYLALPNINTNIAHNTFSVFFVALIGGYMGTAALDLVANKLGFPS
jgi:hypothetical protein